MMCSESPKKSSHESDSPIAVARAGKSGQSAAGNSVSALFTPLQLGQLLLKHRVVMAPLTRSRSVQPHSIPGEVMADYYAQRASDGGLIISEATNISLTSRG